MFAKPKIIQDCITKESIEAMTSESELLQYYFGIYKTGVYNSPFRTDNKPSFSIYEYRGRLMYKDFSTGEYGGVYDMIMKKLNLSFNECIIQIYKDLNLDRRIQKPIQVKRVQKRKVTDIQIRVRQWTVDDTEYWKSYGVDVEFLKQFEIYPIDYYWIKGNVFTASKLAYAYVERIDGKPYIKLYQPKNKKAKWFNNYPPNTISLLSHIVSLKKERLNYIAVCSSVKDALCLWNNVGIPSIAPQGEGYDLPVEMICQKLNITNNQLILMYDNDEAGVKFSTQMSERYGLKNIVIPQFEGGKDISDYYLSNGKEVFESTFRQLLKGYL